MDLRKYINSKHFLLLFLFFFFNKVVFAQTGNISGNIIDSETGEELIGVTVIIEGTTKGAITDISGNYQITTKPGTYNIIASYVSYRNQKINNVEVKEGEITRINLKLSQEDVQLGEVVIQAAAINNNEVALLKLQKKSYAVQDGISSAEIQRLGVNNSAQAMKQVTGASIEGGKYVVMRGLGDRYSITSLNGISLPNTDPYRNSSSLDLIPSAMIENIVTTKTFTPDQPGNFTGGSVDITTKSMPAQFYFNFGVTIGYNTNSSFKESFLTDPLSGSTDWLGFDDGIRELPTFLQEESASEILSDQALFAKVRTTQETYIMERGLFDRTAKTLSQRSFVPAKKDTYLNNSYSLAFGDRLSFLSKDLGYNAGLNFSKNFTNYEDRKLARFAFTSDPNAEELNQNLNTRGQESTESTMISGILGLTYQLNNENELSFNATYTHDAEESAGILSGSFPQAISGQSTFFTRNIAFMERELINYQLGGKHVIPLLNGTKIEWTGAMINSSQYEPDVRLFANSQNTLGYSISKAEYELPFHFWRNLEDQQHNGTVDITIPIGEATGNKIKIGGLYSEKNRDFEEYRYQLSQADESFGEYISFNEAAGDFDAFFAPENSGIVGMDAARNRNILGNYYVNQSRETNFYTGTEKIMAAYGMWVQEISDNLKFIGGARIESTANEVISKDERQPKGVIDELDILPSVNLIYALNESSNLRASASQTLARPNMREMAPFTSFDFIGGYLFSGNPEVERTVIKNFDLRYELFPKAGELIAVSAFYKKFTDPIVKILIPVASGGEIGVRNSENADLYGVELEFRKNITEKFQMGTNLTLIKSMVDLTKEEFEALSRLVPDAEDTRPFQSQSPFIWNVNLTYSDFERLFESTLYMNMFGRRLYANGFGGSPDIYEIYGTNEDNIPIPDLNLRLSKGLTEHFDLTFKVMNILDYEVVRSQEFKDQIFVTESLQKGRTFSLGLKYKL